MYDQMYQLFDQISSNLQCGFRKGFNNGRCLMHMIEKWRKYLDTGDHGSAALTDLSKAFSANGGIPLFFLSLSNIIILFVYLSLPNLHFYAIRSIAMFLKVLNEVNFRVLTQT